MSSEIVAFERKLKDFMQDVTGLVKNAFWKFVTSDKKSAWGDTLNKTTRVVEDVYNKFTKEMNEPEEPPSWINATKDQTMHQYFINNINRLSSQVKKKNK
jgi:hypothetical protein